MYRAMSNEYVATTASTNNTINLKLYDNMTEIIDMLNKKKENSIINSVVSGIFDKNEIQKIKDEIKERIPIMENYNKLFETKYANKQNYFKSYYDIFNNNIDIDSDNFNTIEDLKKLKQKNNDTNTAVIQVEAIIKEEDARIAKEEAAKKEEEARKADESKKKAAEDEARIAAEEAKKAEEEAEAAKKAAEEAKKAEEEAAYTDFKQEALNVLKKIQPPPVPVPVEPVVVQDHYEEFKCKALQHMQQILNNSLLGNLESNSYYNEFKLKAVQIMNKVAFDEEARKVKETAEAEKTKAEAEKQAAIAAADAEKTKAEAEKAAAEQAAKQAEIDKAAVIAAAEADKLSSQEQINKLNYAEFKTKALEKMRDIQLAQDVVNNNYQTFVLKATAVLNKVAADDLTEKIKNNANAISAALSDKEKLEQEFAYKEFKQKAELVLIRSLTGNISKQLADHQNTIETNNYTEFKLKAQMVLTQALLNSQQQKYMEQQQQGLYEQFKSNALNVLTGIVAQQSFYNEFKEKALIVLNDISRDYKIQSLTNDKYYEEFKQKALASLTYMNPELGSTEWVSAL
jgi:hypothetical protein